MSIIRPEIMTEAVAAMAHRPSPRNRGVELEQLVPSLAEHEQREIALMSSRYRKRHQAFPQIAATEQRVAEQKVRIAQLQRLGCDAEISRDILRQMEDALQRMKDHRDKASKSMMNDTA